MKIKFIKFTLIRIIFLSVLTFFSCQKKTTELTPILPKITIGQITSITHNSSRVGAQITFNGNASIIEKGIVYDTSPQLTFNNKKITSNQNGNEFLIDLQNLNPSVKYYVRAFATNSAGTSFSDEISFTTSITTPTLITNQLSDIDITGAICGGNVENDGGSEIIERGVCWSTKTNPTISDFKTLDGKGTGSFKSNVTGLVNGTLYYIRAYATNKSGTSYGNELKFTTKVEPVFNSNLIYKSVSDIDGNVYKTIKIGNQEWMAQDLKVSRYNNGDLIKLETDDTKWINLTSGAYSYYNNDSTLSSVTTNPSKNYLGKLYNWYTVIDNRKVCPSNWHVPSKSEWEILINHLGGASIAGIKLKSMSSMWKDAWGSRNESGFSDLPGGLRWLYGKYESFSTHSPHWSTTEASSNSAYPFINAYAGTHVVFGNIGPAQSGYPKHLGLAIRCLKD